MKKKKKRKKRKQKVQWGDMNKYKDWQVYVYFIFISLIVAAIHTFYNP